MYSNGKTSNEFPVKELERVTRTSEFYSGQHRLGDTTRTSDINITMIGSTLGAVF